MLNINNRCQKCFTWVLFIFSTVCLGCCIASTGNSHGKGCDSNSDVMWKIWVACPCFVSVSPFPLCTTDRSSAVEWMLTHPKQSYESRPPVSQCHSEMQITAGPELDPVLRCTIILSRLPSSETWNRAGGDFPVSGQVCEVALKEAKCIFTASCFGMWHLVQQQNLAKCSSGLSGDSPSKP